VKTGLIAVISLFLSISVSAQQAPKIFIYENITKTSVDSILKAGCLSISDSTYEIKKFAYVITVYGEQAIIIYGINQGSKFSDEFKTKLLKYPSRGDLMISDVFIQKKNTEEPARKLAQHFVINFRTIYK
jgi:hypothetical protein